MKPQLIIVAGTRPEIIKIYPLLKALDKNSVEYTFVWSGQHYDFTMSTIFFEELNVRKPDINLNIPRGTDLVQQVAFIGSRLKKIIKDKYSVVYALGDTSTTAATALATFYLNSNSIFVHDEAGVRSYDPFMIEEGNRKIADTLASFHFAPTVISVINLLREGIPSKNVYLTGSSLVDIFSKFYPKISKKANDVLAKLSIEQGRFVLVTLHRRENLSRDRLRRLAVLLRTIATKYSDYDIVFPVHPHTYLKLKEYGFLNKILSTSNIKLTKPLGYFDFLAVLSASSFVMTDSGGVQQEAFLAGKPTLTLRPYTEWIETVILGYNFIVDLSVKHCTKIIRQILKGERVPEKISLEENPMGDGRSGQRVSRILSAIVDNIENVYETLRAVHHDFRSKTGVSNKVILPALLRKVTDGIMLCFDEEGWPSIYNGRNSVNRERNAHKKLTCITTGHFYLNKEHRKKLMDLIKVKWHYIDEMLFSLVPNNKN